MNVFDSKEDALPSDVVNWVRSRFSTAEIQPALALLDSAVIETGARPSPRLLRCAACASAGELSRLQYYVSLLAIDWRDVIVAGEYDVVDRSLRKTRDLNHPLSADPVRPAD